MGPAPVINNNIINKIWNDTSSIAGCTLHVFIAYFGISAAYSGIVGYSYSTHENPSQSFVLDPLLTMLNTRAGRGRLALDRARGYFCGTRDLCLGEFGVNAGYFRSKLPLESLDFPLGWKLPARVAPRQPSRA
jgi:hypothetical protein